MGSLTAPVSCRVLVACLTTRPESSDPRMWWYISVRGKDKHPGAPGAIPGVQGQGDGHSVSRGRKQRGTQLQGGNPSPLFYLVPGDSVHPDPQQGPPTQSPAVGPSPQSCLSSSSGVP